MPTRRPADRTPDLFSAPPTVTAAGPSAAPKGKAGSDSLASQQRHFLPKDLAGALKRLNDVEIDALLAAVTTEAERRGQRPPSPAKEKPAAEAKSQRRKGAAEDGAGSLTTGKLNAVRAAFKAGVKPSAIARQFGISQSDVRKALTRGAASRSLIWLSLVNHKIGFVKATIRLNLILREIGAVLPWRCASQSHRRRARIVRQYLLTGAFGILVPDISGAPQLMRAGYPVVTVVAGAPPGGTRTRTNKNSGRERRGLKVGGCNDERSAA